MYTREWFREQYRKPLPTGTIYPGEQADYMADVAFKHLADSSGTMMDADKIRRDVLQLENQTERVVTYADRALAHDEKGGPKLDQPLNYNDIETAIQAVEKVAKEYLALLTGAAWITLTPIDLTGAVQVFRIPWISE